MNAVDNKIEIKLSDAEAAQGDPRYSELRELYAVLHARISIYYYSKQDIQVSRTDSFKVL